MTPKTEAFKTYWDHAYSTTPPVGHLLREAFPDIWFRIYSLPRGKRYPDTAREMIEILARHNAVLNDLLAQKGKYILIATDYSSDERPSDTSLRLASSGEKMEYVWSECFDEFDTYYWHFFMAEMKWSNGAIDDLLRLIAEEEISDVLLVDLEKAYVYHPYDGGSDIFIKDPEKRESMKSRFSEWLSPHPLGV